MFNHFKFPIMDLTWSEAMSRNLYTCVVLTVFAALLAAEVRRGRLRYTLNTLRQTYKTNVYTWVFNDTMLSLLSISSLYLAAERNSGSGVLANIPNPFWQAVVALILYDLILYFWHRAGHKCDWLWIFHKVHHSDRWMNVSTAFRVHVVELLLTSIVKAAFIFATGISSAILLVAEGLITLNVMFHHAAIRFRGERRLGLVFATPHLHRVHHSAQRSEHDNNYGALFSIWDRIFGTLAELEPQEIGLKNVPAQNFWELLKFGFNSSPNGAATVPNPQSILAMIAEAAYYRAEKRNFAPGFEMFDWFEAEKEILLHNRVSRHLFSY
jgi:sterol desaturase/sphingolipid hydroxylase (fatty acid hydroxylase superfamily)